MKTKFRTLFISLLLMIAMLLGVFAMTPMTASAVSTTPDPTKIPAETIYVGGVELGFGQYVKNGETTATTGQPAEDSTGFAWYTPDGAALVLVDYAYTGKGYEYSSGKYALIYSTGTLYVAGGGVNTLKQTQSGNMGIYSVGALTIAPMGTLTIESNNDSCLYSNNEITFGRYLGTVNLKSTGNAFAIVSYDNDGDARDEQGIIVNGGDIYVETFYPISDLTIRYGALKVSSPQNALSEMPVITNYDGGYTLTVSENEDGSNSKIYHQDNITTFDSSKITDYKYFRIAPPAKTVINSVSVSDLDLPEIGEAFVYPDETALTYGGEYIVSGCWIEKYTGTEWIYLEDTEVIEHSVRYRYVLTLRPNAGYTFTEDITDDDVMINGQEGAVLMSFSDDAFTTMVEVALEFSYEALATDYGITIADKDESGATGGVEITSENCTDVLGDGTVSYDPTTNTLTLNNYVYNGEGALVDEGGYMAIMADIPTEGLTIVLVGTNSITVSGSDSAGMV
ncbi:MAG: carbohydrate-binding domain-containing protein, partial [Clostridia bacterium]|nr:carbohydrate-binding domain-containing protein [Clostridia bacterium]